MKRLSWVWWVALLLLTLLFMVVRLPASLVSTIIAAQTGNKFTLAGTSGSIWQGAGQPVVDGQALAEQLTWQWRPADLLKASIGYDLKLDTGQAQLNLGPKDISLRNADLTIAASPLFKLAERTRAYGLTGQLRLATTELHWPTKQSEGQLSVDWRGAGSSLAPTMPVLGDYRANLSPAGNAWQIQLSTLSGQLLLNGSGNWQASQGLTAEVTLQASPGSAPALAPFLNQIGDGSPETPRRLQFNLR
ncbi:type II secretion system protein N [Chitinimonas sp. PSY-7]|uniref:type II secretion system protein N n=1 Tax=Chitinimonas sp. PSY-7 TaxID=3459088 RepID=UPI00403FF962